MNTNKRIIFTKSTKYIMLFIQGVFDKLLEFLYNRLHFSSKYIQQHINARFLCEIKMQPKKSQIIVSYFF